eukprot:CAMPEP_0183729176 /NCGR_PEP_ID=MMETSP0737-20130205/29877_1 /TAXON_ID=385413 /ORGANISM="Thalassiosira miniscula, Strain CCMP1093" /LENGTH=311 /DNA_ID=CAMNT_0025961307 /DNA_START=180 /DNA_END=1115 /DNA_ORIENTATION=+
MTPGYRSKDSLVGKAGVEPCKKEYDAIDNRAPIMKSKSRGFRPVYVYSFENPPTNYDSFSQARQDALIRTLTDTIREGLKETADAEELNRAPFFVDLAANDAVTFSNTLTLERHGWDGLCLEPNPQYWFKLAAFRKCTIVGTFVGGTQEEDGKEIDVYLPTGGRGVFGGIVADDMDNTGGANAKRNLVSLLTIFQETNVPKVIDYLSLDVEGAEFLVMSSFPWDQYRFKFMTIERPTEDMIKLLHRNGYKMVLIIAEFGETVWINKELVVMPKELIRMLAEQEAKARTWDSWWNTIDGVRSAGGFPDENLM